VNEKSAWARNVAELLTLVVCYPSAASEPSLLSAIWVSPAALLGLSSVHVFTRTWQWLSRPINWETGSALLHRQCWCECCDISSLSVSVSPHYGQLCQDQQPPPLSNALASAGAPQRAWESPCPQRCRNLAGRLMGVACTSGGQKWVAPGCILLAQELQ